MAIRTALFKASRGFPGHDGRLSGCGLPAFVIIEPRPQENKPEKATP
jgi:hypothetical protein